eukprot:1993665-Pleurochrysis_carterae.AAC.2
MGGCGRSRAHGVAMLRPRGREWAAAAPQPIGDQGNDVGDEPYRRRARKETGKAYQRRRRRENDERCCVARTQAQAAEPCKR